MLVTQLGYFKPPQDVFLAYLRAKDQRSVKEWECINATGVWVEMGLMALEEARDDTANVDDMGLCRRLSESSFKAALEVLSMRAQYFRDITEQGVESARQMSFLVEQGNDAVFSESYRTAREALTKRLEVEAAKQLSQAHMENTKGRAHTQGGSSEGPAGGQ